MGQRAAALGWRVSSEPRVAFVTGASRGIGRAIAVALARDGHRVAFCYGNDDTGAKETQDAIEDLGCDALSIRADVTDTEAVDRAFAEVEGAWGAVHILVNNAGIARDGLVARMTDEQWDEVLQTNLTGAFRTIRRATRGMMKARYGRIVNVSSASGQLGAPGQVNYAAAKAGLVGLSRSIARELASRNVTCNVVAPGPIVTSMTEAMPDDWRAWAEGAVPLGRLGTTEECAAVVAFLCSEAAGYVTGALVPVDGGLAMGH